MKCPKCETEVHSSSVFCPKCGERLDSPDREFFPSPAQAPPGAGLHAGPPQTPGEQLLRPKTDGAAETPADARSRIEQMVESDRETLWVGRYSFKGIVPWMILAGLVLILLAFVGWWVASHEWKWWGDWGGRWFWQTTWIGVIGVWLWQLLLFAWRRLAHRYRLTPQTFFHERGIVFRSTSPIEIVGIDDMTFEQTILERLFGVGTIRLLSKDMSDPMVVMKGLPNVKDAFAKIDQARRAERRARAVRVDNV
jgi:membrane protein YdbS with pleckstrin-like domain